MYAVVTETSSEPTQQAKIVDLDRELVAFLEQRSGCRGYLMIDKEDGGHVSIILWNSKEVWDASIHTEAHDQLLARMRPLLTSRPAIYRGTIAASNFSPLAGAP